LILLIRHQKPVVRFTRLLSKMTGLHLVH
jgi:hypothetical protein